MKLKSLVYIPLSVLALFAVITGGLAVFDERVSVSKHTHVVSGVEIELSFRTHFSELDIPLFHYYYTRNKYNLQFQAVDCKGDFDWMTIHEICVEDNKRKIDWKRTFEQWTSYNAALGGGEVQKDTIFVASGIVDVIVPPDFAGNVSVVGALQKKNGVALPFEWKVNVTNVTQRRFRVFPYWLVRYVNRNYKT